MSETMFDESFNIRELLDDVIERVALREKLIQTAKQFSEKKREEKFTMAIRQFENLMADYLRLQQPVLERLRNYRESLQKEIQSLRSSQATINGMLEVSRGIEGLAARAQQLESDGQQLDGRLKDRAKTADKIDDLFNRIRPHQSGGSSMQQGRDPLADVLAGMPKDLFPDSSDMGGKETTRKSGGRS
jgi:type II secretory pathway component PulM